MRASGCRPKFLVSTAQAGVVHVYASLGLGQAPPVATVQVQPAQQAPQLRLFLDAEPFNFQQPGDDDLPQYVPGSNLDGTSRPVQPEGTPLQQIRVIAAFVDGSEQIVPPPVTQVTFSLHDTSAFKGYAMNAGTSEDPDFAFTSGQPQVTAGFSGNLSWANVDVFDYGGITTARVTADGYQPVDMRIPKDDNDNWIADAGWRAYGHQGHPAQQVDDCTGANCQWADEDGMPTGSGPPDYGLAGDGLTTWEEYRGFIVRGTHVRTHPGHKDLFVASVVADTGLLVNEALEYARENLRRNNATMAEIGVRLHHVWGEDDTNIPQGQAREYSLDQGAPDPFLSVQRRINFNEPADRGLIPQRAVRIRVEALPMGTPGEWRGECWPVNQPNQQGVYPGGGVPYSTIEIIVHVDQHEGNHHELKRTVAHEIGHAINIMHRTGGPDCNDGVTVSAATSVMSAMTGASGDVSSPDAQFDADDVPQIRIRWDDVPP